jgi:hypothetical protein
VSEWHREPDHAGFVVTDDPGRVDLDVVHGYLSGESYWAAERTRAAQATANAASWCFSLIAEGMERLLTPLSPDLPRSSN